MLYSNQGFSLLSVVFAVTLMAIIFSLGAKRFIKIQENAATFIQADQQLQILREIQLDELGLIDQTQFNQNISNNTTNHNPDLYSYFQKNKKARLQGRIVSIGGQLFLQIPLHDQPMNETQ